MKTQQIFVKLKSKAKQNRSKKGSDVGEFISFQLWETEQLQENYYFMLSHTLALKLMRKIELLMWEDWKASLLTDPLTRDAQTLLGRRKMNLNTCKEYLRRKLQESGK